jgi:hypothetical protein
VSPPLTRASTARASPTNVRVPEAGRARYLRYLMRRSVEQPLLLLRGAKAIASPHVLYLDLAAAPSRSMMILSSQRSGSTLLGEVLGHHDRQRLMFEPFWSVGVGETRNIVRGRYADPDSDDPKLDRVLKTVLGGRMRNLSVDRLNRSRFPRGRVIKDCYATNLVPYLAAHFPEVPLILLLRHPLATAHSALSLGWKCELETFLDQDDLISGQFPAQARLIKSVVASERQTEAGFVLRWCLENYLPVQMLSRASTHVVFYEDLVRTGEAELRRLAVFLRRRSATLWSEWRPDPALLLRPSRTMRRDGRDRSREELLRGWQLAVSPSQLERSLEILEAFGLDRLFGAGPYPLVSADEVLVRP